MIPYVRKGEWLETAVSPERLPIPEKLLKRWEREGGVRHVGAKRLLRMFPDEPANFVAEWRELDVLYEDDFCLVVNKPPQMPVHPPEAGGTGSLANVVAAYFEATGQALKVRHIHRLDADTTGAVLYAKNEFAHMVLDAAMRERTIDRVYAAIVKGVPQPPAGTIRLAIGKDRHHAGRRRVSPTGQPAVTHYETAEEFARSGRSVASLVRLRLETGRTHQVRVHLGAMGCPIYGDALYGGPRHRLLSRQALHCETIRFLHPFHGAETVVNAPLPADMVRLLDELRKI